MINEKDICGYGVNWDNTSGIDWDESFGKYDFAKAYHRYLSLPETVPYKDFTVDVYGMGTLTLLNSKGEDNIKKYGLSHLVW